jgi:putative ABC transport system ATP-binding protein
MRMSAMIKIENVSKVYGKGKKNQVQALKSIDLELEQGHNYAIIGKSGSGKSTLMNMIGLLDLPTEGKMILAIIMRGNRRNIAIWRSGLYIRILD